MVTAPTPYLNNLLHKLAPYIFPVIGLACIIEPEIMTDYSPVLLGLAMVVGGFYAHLEALRHKAYASLVNSDLGTSLLLMIVGAVVLVKREGALEFMGYTWGLLGIAQGAKMLDEALAYFLQAQKPWIRLLWGLLNVVLGVLLLLDPQGHFSHHIELLGLELMVYSAQRIQLFSYLGRKLVHTLKARRRKAEAGGRKKDQNQK